MAFEIKILDPQEIELVIPLVYELNAGKVSIEALQLRFAEMVSQNYECAVIMDDKKVIGVCGLWYCTRHYVGKTVEIDHVYIIESYRNKGLGEQFMLWLEKHIKIKGCNTMELNTYVENFASHKFYNNQGYILRGYHYLKRLPTS